MADYTRKHDLEELYKLRSEASNSYWRDIYDRTIDKILREKVPVRSLRDKLLRAIRGGDLRAIKRYNLEISAIMRSEGRLVGEDGQHL